MLKDVRRRFDREQDVEDVPVIARAQDALSDEDAWAAMDAMLEEESPISCGPEHAKDLYEIALGQIEDSYGDVYDEYDDDDDAVEDELEVDAEDPISIDDALDFASQAWERAGQTNATSKDDDAEEEMTASMSPLSDDLFGDAPIVAPDDPAASDDLDIALGPSAEPVTLDEEILFPNAHADDSDDDVELAKPACASVGDHSPSDGSETALAVLEDETKGYPNRPDVWASAYGILYDEEAASAQPDRPRSTKRPPKLYICHHFKMEPAEDGSSKELAGDADASVENSPIGAAGSADNDRQDRIAAEAHDRVLEIMREELCTAHLDSVIKVEGGDHIESGPSCEPENEDASSCSEAVCANESEASREQSSDAGCEATADDAATDTASVDSAPSASSSSPDAEDPSASAAE
ncbi:hypothetical protein Corgl_1141 [Coriobacterium glomerans PW2]|uniref:Uncharacterized protein n=1 Tax=Coriobacterium glomerans (strain ATCC 49209 / DSM 20642 / JCM 10262 / PW2) TaxID=700015 RepID=F2N864_CORGP|nr:hypothetical protein [Coriobacterium glomerans]AEB07247.1 hypothetical protein Corgl_1141 [Coriobacterium glomerans PW2]